jgi:hypothetical protein
MNHDVPKIVVKFKAWRIAAVTITAGAGMAAVGSLTGKGTTHRRDAP